MPLKEFLNLYCTKKKENIFIIKNNMPDESKNTILYFLFINNYITNIDDYSGTYVIKKVSQSIFITVSSKTICVCGGFAYETEGLTITEH